jgi:hypothetical protein
MRHIQLPEGLRGIFGFPACRPNLIGDPHAAPHTVDQFAAKLIF